MGVRTIDAGRAHLVDLLTRLRFGIGQVDDVEDLGPYRSPASESAFALSQGVLDMPDEHFAPGAAAVDDRP
jgi:hypothetical protein